MSLVRYQFPHLTSYTSSFDRLNSLRDELDRLFDTSFPTRDSGLLSTWTPPLDVYDEKDHVVVTVELPGFRKEDINISLHEGVLTVSGERRVERDASKKADAGTYRSERRYGKFQRSISLPVRVNPDGVTASYKDGVLSVSLAKVEEAKPRQIEVNVS